MRQFCLQFKPGTTKSPCKTVDQIGNLDSWCIQTEENYLHVPSYVALVGRSQKFLEKNPIRTTELLLHIGQRTSKQRSKEEIENGNECICATNTSFVSTKHVSTILIQPHVACGWRHRPQRHRVTLPKYLLFLGWHCVSTAIFEIIIEISGVEHGWNFFEKSHFNLESCKIPKGILRSN